MIRAVTLKTSRKPYVIVSCALVSFYQLDSTTCKRLPVIKPAFVRTSITKQPLGLPGFTFIGSSSLSNYSKPRCNVFLPRYLDGLGRISGLQSRDVPFNVRGNPHNQAFLPKV
ncbi:hypothetical protein ElyMa_006493800 [Elysia marginata]|uniref:Uncharacterized protein n=1 Tax=Elysia marginata TaxID=1093978 RepID=A0AAV4I1I8_9GAST|nr:hypothetical protein ElyMa_006493800 [Elysia marginata]